MSAPQRLIMDAVNAFNLELFSMIDMKPPISRAKMMSVTKSAIKAIKLYKHVVQIVEKFIKKCKPELKVPGLYVVDSIIRQSRHQFGVDKDVFAPRFLKNFTDTFQNLYLCPVDDKSKIVRVLNLWQKNGVFDMDIIQPLLDMATGPFVVGSTHGGVAATQAETHPPVTSASVVSPLPQLHNSDALAAVAQLFQSSQGQELQRLLQNFQQGDMPQAPMMANTIPAHLQMTATAQLNPHSTQPTEHRSSLAKKLLDRFDYDDEPEDVKKYEMNSTAPPHLGVPGNMYTQFVGQMPNMEHFQPQVMGNTNAAGNQLYGGLMLGGMQQLAGVSQMITGGYPPLNEAYAQQTAQQSQGNSREDSSMRRDGKPRGHGRKSRSRSGSRSPRRRMSRSTSGSLRSRQRRSHSRSREQRLHSPRSRSQERKEREKDREHRQKGLPSIKSQTLSVCSTTLWVGQLDKRTQQQDVTSLLEEFGQIESINMIPPRGCAYIVMVHRQDAYKALQKLSKGSFKVNQKAIKIAWALNKGIKAAHKKFWDVERGVTYIPWSKVKVEELESCRQGGMLDMETLNPVWNGTVKDQNKAGVNNASLESIKSEGSVTAHVQVPPVLPAGSIGGPSAFPGSMVLPPPSIPPGGPPPPFLPTGFDHTKMPPGFPSPVVGAGNTTEEAAKDPAGGIGAPSDVGSDNLLGSPGGPMMSPQGPTGLLGHRPGMQPFHPPGLPPPHLQPFLPPPNMPPMLPQMMPRSPNRMFPPGRFRMPMSHPPMADFPPHGPPFPPGPSMGPKEDDWEERRFRNDGPGFGREQDRFGERPPYQRGGGGNGWSRDAAEGRDHFMNRHDR